MVCPGSVLSPEVCPTKLMMLLALFDAAKVLPAAPKFSTPKQPLIEFAAASNTMVCGV